MVGQFGRQIEYCIGCIAVLFKPLPCLSSATAARQLGWSAALRATLLAPFVGIACIREIA
ncbi:hypothetical protein COCNU_scaffold003985G000010 [Cocos nucifera]|nr:hypothetical protein [Cocos nucifera]